MLAGTRVYTEASENELQLGSKLFVGGVRKLQNEEALQVLPGMMKGIERTTP